MSRQENTSCNDSCNSCCKKCCLKCKTIKIKRYFLPGLGVLAMLPFEEYRNLIYFPIIITFASFILFWNFPRIVYYTASKPLYYEDLFIDVKKLPNYDVNKKVKKRFQFVLEVVLIITNSILMGVLSDIWLLRTDTQLDIFGIIGITGGVIKIFQIVNNTISRVMLKIVRKFVLKESADIREKQKQQIHQIIQLKEFDEKNEMTPDMNYLFNNESQKNLENTINKIDRFNSLTFIPRT